MNNFLSQIELVGYVNNNLVSKNTSFEMIEKDKEKQMLIKLNLIDKDLISIFNKNQLMLGDIFFNKKTNKFYLLYFGNLIEQEGMFYGFSLYHLHDLCDIDYEVHSEKHDKKTEM